MRKFQKADKKLNINTVEDYLTHAVFCEGYNHRDIMTVIQKVAYPGNYTWNDGFTKVFGISESEFNPEMGILQVILRRFIDNVNFVGNYFFLNHVIFFKMEFMGIKREVYLMH